MAPYYTNEMQNGSFGRRRDGIFVKYVKYKKIKCQFLEFLFLFVYISFLDVLTRREYFISEQNHQFFTNQKKKAPFQLHRTYASDKVQECACTKPMSSNTYA